MPSIEELQQEQQRIASAMFACIDLDNEASIAELNQEYALTVDALISALGPAAPCAMVDAISWSFYQTLRREESLPILAQITRGDARDYVGSRA